MVDFNRKMLSQSRVIARGRGIRDVNRLVLRYGGMVSKWVKKSGPKFRLGTRSYEYHWYEHVGLGRFEIKRKQVTQK